MSNDITITVGTADVSASGEAAKPIAKYGVGKTVRGKIVNFKPYGFFVETEGGGFGLVHGNNIEGWGWSKRFDRVFRHGMEIEVKVIDIESDTNRMSFSCTMPQIGEDPKVEMAVAPSAVPVRTSRAEAAEKWRGEHPSESAAAYEWLKTELEDGPLFGPLTNTLCDRFGVPVPASSWILLFPEFVCYSGRGDNPKDLPAVALADKAGSIDYWNRIKDRTDSLIENRNRPADDTPKFGLLMKRLDAVGAFPGAAWIRDYMETARGMVRGKSVYGTQDVVERMVLPMLGQLGWCVSSGNAALVRGGGFDVRIYEGSFSSDSVALAVLCSPAGTGFRTLRGEQNIIERMLGLYNRLGGGGPSAARIVWTDGIEWVVFSRELLGQCIGVLAEHRGEELMNDADGKGFFRVEFPTDGTLSGWLASFADAYDLIGKGAN